MRLIDADALPKIVLISADGDVLEVVDAFKKMINEAPTIGREPIVYCKDCKYWKQAYGWDAQNYKRCICLDRDTNAYFYCAYREKINKVNDD